YVFLAGPVTLHALREDRVSRVDPAVTRRYATLWLDHGTDPVDQSYAYLMAPLASAARTAELAASPGVTLLANDAEVQAIWQAGLGVRTPVGLLGANFFSAGTIQVLAMTLTVDSPASVAIERGTSQLEIAVADPTHVVDSLTVTLDGITHR